MRTFYELCEGKMWRAVEAMIVGLETQSKRDDFRIAMSTFGKAYKKYGKPVCFGCAATCAVQQLTGVNIGVDNIEPKNHADAIGTLAEDTIDFEGAIDGLRTGYIDGLAEYFKVPSITINHSSLYRLSIQYDGRDYLPILNSQDWEKNLHRYRVLLRYLKWRDI